MFLLDYVENCEPKLKFFDDKKSLNKFIKKFSKESENDVAGSYLNYWSEISHFQALDEYYKQYGE